MAEASQWRSSEYSERAEDLFAEYVRARRAGEAPEFEAFCAQHPELEDELCGLLTDWENVGGVVERLIAEPAEPAPRPLAQPAAPAAPVARPTPPPKPEPAPRSEPRPAPAAPKRSYGLLATFVVLLAALGAFAFLEWRGGQALAAERDEIAQLQEQTAELAERAVERSTELREQNQQLETRAERSEREREEARVEREAAEQARAEAEARARASEEQTARMAARIELTELASAVAALAPEALDAQEALRALRAQAAELGPRLAGPEDSARLTALEAALDQIEAAAARLREERELWAAAAAAIGAHPAYPGVELGAQEGLAPLGEDPDSGLWEFAHLATGTAPTRDAEGALELSDESGLVLVLVPPGPERPAFFLARAPLSAAQWERAGGDPQAEPSDVEYPLVLEGVGLAPAGADQLAAAGITPAEDDPPLPARAL